MKKKGKKGITIDVISMGISYTNAQTPLHTDTHPHTNNIKRFMALFEGGEGGIVEP